MKVYLVKYAASKGIQELHAEEPISIFSFTAVDPKTGRRCQIWAERGVDYTEDLEEAKELAHDVIDARRESLERTLARLDKLEEKARDFKPKG